MIQGGKIAAVGGIVFFASLSLLQAHPDSLDQQLRIQIKRHQLTPLQNPKTHQTDSALFRLGQALFFDKELSGNRDISCGTCHHPNLGSSDALNLPVGTGGIGLGPDRWKPSHQRFIPRNSPDIFNRANSQWRTMFWDARVFEDSDGKFVTPANENLPAGFSNLLSVQAVFPITSRDEMRGNKGDVDVFLRPNELAAIEDDDFTGIWQGIVKRVKAIPSYVDLIQDAYPDLFMDNLSIVHLGNAIGAFEEAAFSFDDSPWDQYLAGTEDALSEPEKRGALLFYGRAKCYQCHSGSLFTDQKTHNLAVPQIGPGKGKAAPFDHGRSGVTNSVFDQYQFRTPPLRNVELTSPYMHNGTYDRLEDVIWHHNNPIESYRNYSDSSLRLDLVGTRQFGPKNDQAMFRKVSPTLAYGLGLTSGEVGELTAFLRSLTSPRARDLSHLVPDQVPSGLSIDN